MLRIRQREQGSGARNQGTPLETLNPSLPTLKKELPAQLLRRLEFKVLKRLDGFLFGSHKGVFYGPSLDLAEVREYQPGDEIRRIDWNVTARTGLLHVRQYHEEREVTSWILVDLSPSMNFGTRRVLKWEEALEFVGTAAAVITRNGDKVGVIGFSPGGIRVVTPGSGRKQTLRILNELYSLSQAKPSGAGQVWAMEQALEYAAKTLKRKALVFVVSDFITPNPIEVPPWTGVLRHMSYRHDVVAVQISDPAEWELPKAGELRLRDPETGQEVWVDTSDPRVRAAYTRLVAQRVEMLQRTFSGAKVDVLKLSTKDDIVQPILKFSLKRKGRR